MVGSRYSGLFIVRSVDRLSVQTTKSPFLRLKLAHIRRVEGHLYLLLSLNMFLKSSASNRFGVVYNFGMSRVVLSFILLVMLGSPVSDRMHLVGEVGKA